MKSFSVSMFLVLAVLLSSEVASAQVHFPAGRYAIWNVNSGLAMSVRLDSYDNGANIHQWLDYSGSLGQRWYILSTGDGYFMLQNVRSGKVADIEGPTTANSGNIHQWQYLGLDSQKWSVVPVGQNPTYYVFINKYSGKALDVAFNSKDNGANIHQWQYLGLTSQQWQVVGPS